MKSIWLVESGSYSDYRVDYICATEEIANLLAERINKRRTYDQASVQKSGIIESLEETQERKFWRVVVNENGEDVTANKEPILYIISNVPNSTAWIRTSRKGKQTIGGADAYSDRSYEVALKAARDKLYQAKAELEGL